MSQKISVLGSGSFGTAMAYLFSQKGHDVTIWGRDDEIIDEINQQHTNEKFLPSANLQNIKATSDLKVALKNPDYVLFAIPCQSLRELFLQIKLDLSEQPILINLAKGIEIDTLATPSQIFASVFGESYLNRFATISGPTFAKEMYLGMPTGAVVASKELSTAKKIQTELSLKHFRLYSSTDLIGVELGGASKNVMAIELGIADGLGFGQNTRAGLLPRCLYEMTQLGVALGAKARTFSGLSGLGDLILTCTGDLSRNRQVGLRLGRGEKIEDVIKSMSYVAEGIPTAKSLYQLSQKMKIEMPNTEHVYKILYEGMSPREAVESILKRELRAEYEDA